MYAIRKIWKPEIYQGSGKKTGYFEGWYFKLVDHRNKNSLAVIPGISRESREKGHAFVQIIEGGTGKTMHFRYPANEFYYSKKKLEVIINTNYFSEDRINLDIQEEKNCIQGSVEFSERSPLKSNLLNPGIMGWYSFVPFMECYHGLVSLDHSLTGGFRMNEKDFDFSGGRGYIEKDWGKSFPSSWIWMQTNHFNRGRSSFTFSIARIPWLRSHFIGHIGILLLDGKQYRFATYNGSRVTSLKVNGRSCEIGLKKRGYSLIVRATGRSSGTLAAPVSGAMDRRISESIDSEIEVVLSDGSGNLLFSDTGQVAGLEIAGDTAELMELN